MRTFLGILLISAVTCCGLLRAEPIEAFPKVGAWYQVATFTNAPPPFSNCGSDGGSYSYLDVKIIRHGIDQWYWVEYDFNQTNKTELVTITKKRLWLNFAQLAVVDHGGEIDYTRTYPQGFKIVPYKE